MVHPTKELLQQDMAPGSPISTIAPPEEAMTIRRETNQAHIPTITVRRDEHAEVIFHLVWARHASRWEEATISRYHSGSRRNITRPGCALAKDPHRDVFHDHCIASILKNTIPITVAVEIGIIHDSALVEFHARFTRSR